MLSTSMLNNLQNKPDSITLQFQCYTEKVPVLFKGSRKHQKPKPRPSDVAVLTENTMQGEDLTSKLLLKDQLYFK